MCLIIIRKGYEKWACVVPWDISDYDAGHNRARFNAVRCRADSPEMQIYKLEIDVMKYGIPLLAVTGFLKEGFNGGRFRRTLFGG